MLWWLLQRLQDLIRYQSALQGSVSCSTSLIPIPLQMGGQSADLYCWTGRLGRYRQSNCIWNRNDPSHVVMPQNVTRDTLRITHKLIISLFCAAAKLQIEMQQRKITLFEI